MTTRGSTTTGRWRNRHERAAERPDGAPGHHRQARRDPLRRGQRRQREDDPAGGPAGQPPGDGGGRHRGGGRHHLHRGGRGGAARPAGRGARAAGGGRPRLPGGQSGGRSGVGGRDHPARLRPADPGGAPPRGGPTPVFEVLDGFQSLVDFDERWAELVDRLLADPDDARALQVAAACRVGTNVLREIAQKFEDNWDLLPAGPAPPIPPPQVDVSAVLRPLQEAFALADRCTDPGDRLLDHLAALGPWAERLASCTGELEALGVMARLGKTKLSSGSGRKENWGGLKESVTDRLARRPVGSRSERGRRRAGRAGAVGVGHRSAHPAVGRAAAGRRAPALPRSVGAGPGPRARRPRRPAGAPRPVPVPPDRRVPGHRPHPGRAGGAHRRAP